MQIDSKELQEYIRTTLTSVSNAINEAGSFRLSEPIEFDLAVTNVKSGGGDLKIYVASADGKFQSEEVSKIKFKVSQRPGPSTYVSAVEKNNPV